MSIFTYRNEKGVVEFHLIMKHNVGIDKKNVLFSNLPIELLEESNPQICKLVKSQSKRLDGSSKEILEHLSLYVLEHPSLSKYIYSKEVLCGGVMKTKNLLELMLLWDDMKFYPGTIVSWDISPVRQYIFTVMLQRFYEFHREKYYKAIIPITRGYFEQNMFTLEVWSEYKKFNQETPAKFFWTKTMRGFDCFIMTIEGKPVLEFVN